MRIWFSHFARPLILTATLYNVHSVHVDRTCSFDDSSVKTQASPYTEACEATTEDKVKLQRVKELQEYAFHTHDGDLGKVRTFYFDEEGWHMQAMVVDTGACFANRHVLSLDCSGALGHHGEPCGHGHQQRVFPVPVP
jgi:hypothetical protein